MRKNKNLQTAPEEIERRAREGTPIKSPLGEESQNHHHKKRVNRVSKDRHPGKKRKINLS